MTSLGGVNRTGCSAEQYQQSLLSQDNPIPLISCLTHGQTIGLTVIIQPCPSFLELILRAADNRNIIVESFIRDRYLYLDCCKPDSESLHAYVLSDEMLHSGIDDGTRKMSQRVVGSCLRAQLTSIWSV
jgi:hypothetical protein